jgi:aspartate/methionine/tyrosine aminotransferase
MRVLSSEYMHWAKTQSNARFNLATSGMPNVALADLPVKLDELEITTSSPYGYPPLIEAIAAHAGVSIKCIVTAEGTSMANHLAMAAMIAPGDEVLVEQPTYGLLLEVARYLGANVKRFPRKVENGFRVEAEEISKQLNSRTKLIVLTNLHNPSSALIENEILKEIGEIARAVGARVLVDEAYLESAYELQPRTSFQLGEQFVVTGSLTKFYGLSGLRCGWIFADPELVTKMWRLNDLFASSPVHTAERMSVIAFRNLERAATRSRALLEANRPLLTSFLRSRKDLDWVEQKYGTVGFPRVLNTDAEELCALLAEKYETSVVPGRFFEMPQHVRIGVGCETGILKQGLDRLGAALDDFRS